MAARQADADSFVKMFKSGARPDGGKIAMMPFESLAQVCDTDARALHLHPKSQAKKLPRSLPRRRAASQ